MKHENKKEKQSIETHDKDCCPKQSHENVIPKNTAEVPQAKTIDEAIKNQSKFLSFGSNTVTVILILLVLLSLSQMIQTANLFKTANNANFATQEINSGINTNTTSNSTLPDMVGGC